jgi:hypothetical protein
MTEDLREAKQFEHKFKTYLIMNNSLDQENKRLMDRLEVKMETEGGDGGQ